MTIASDSLPESLDAAPPTALFPVEPPRDCPLCPRLVAAREALREQNPTWWNAPGARLRRSGRDDRDRRPCPGLHGANRTGRAFTGDHSGTLLFATLVKVGLATGTFANRPTDDIALTGAIILNAVKCLPPANKPTPEEIRTCRQYLDAEIAALPNVRVVVALGQIAHQSAVKEGVAAGCPRRRSAMAPNIACRTGGCWSIATTRRATIRTPAASTKRCSRPSSPARWRSLRYPERGDRTAPAGGRGRSRRRRGGGGYGQGRAWRRSRPLPRDRVRQGCRRARRR